MKGEISGCTITQKRKKKEVVQLTSRARTTSLSGSMTMPSGTLDPYHSSSCTFVALHSIWTCNPSWYFRSLFTFSPWSMRMSRKRGPVQAAFMLHLRDEFLSVNRIRRSGFGLGFRVSQIDMTDFTYTAPSPQSTPVTSFTLLLTSCRRFPAHCNAHVTVCWANLRLRSSMLKVTSMPSGGTSLDFIKFDCSDLMVTLCVEASMCCIGPWLRSYASGSPDASWLFEGVRKLFTRNHQSIDRSINHSIISLLRVS